METQLDLLIRLSAVDETIAELEGKLDAIPKAIDAKKSTLAGVEQKLEAAQERRAEMQKEHRQAEGALDSHLDKIRKLNDQTSMVKTNKEYQAILAEIQGLKSEQDKYEERILELMEQAGEVEGTIKSVEVELAEAKKAFAEEEKTLLAEEERLKAELSRVTEERRGMESAVEGENILTYSKVKRLRGDAVAEVRDELCLGCRVSVPPQKYADVITGGSIQTCSHCQRILYHRPAVATGDGEEG
jgi:predicted  nucleic acid-binding Zn-ribbon protein